MNEMLKVIVQYNDDKEKLVAALYEPNGNTHLYSVAKLLKHEQYVDKIAQFVQKLVVGYCGARYGAEKWYYDPEPCYYMQHYDAAEVYDIEFERLFISSANTAMWHLESKGFFYFEPAEQEGGV